jgi:D-xylose transport system permease protein
MSTLLNDPRLKEDESQAGSRLGRLRRRLGRTDLGFLPVLLGLGVIWIVFQIANEHFLSPLNLTNLMLQIAAEGLISIGIVLILLLGEIDLSVGAVSGLCGGIMAVLNVKAGLPGPLAVLICLLAGFAIGLFQGFWFTRMRIPSFVVTLAGLLGWQGVQLLVLGNTGTINLRNAFIVGIANTFFPAVVGWIVGLVFVLVFILQSIAGRASRKKAGLTYPAWQAILWQGLVVTGAVFGGIAILNANRGLPLAVVIFVGLVILFDLITRHTLFGRHIFAVGGAAEAARRASINVDRIRILVFGLASTLAAAGGVLAGSRLLSVNQSSGSSDTLLNSIAAAVIGGTSLFGGRGSVWAALIGSLVIGSISNGMDLLALESPIKFMITGAVLLASVTIDALARRQREVSGR